MSKSKIEWTESTWNPVTGCNKLSAGCKNCYAERMSRRLLAMGNANYANGFEVTEHPHMLDKPKRWRKPQRIFVNSMSDLFHPEVSFNFIAEVFETMRVADHHIYQVLTKRPDRMLEYVTEQEKEGLPPHIWLGTSVEQRRWLSRVDLLRQVPAAVRFLSLEPLLEDLGQFDLSGINWVIVGGESGPGARRMEREWVASIRDSCLAESVPFFFKQWGGVIKSKAGRLLDDRTWDEMPEVPLAVL